MHGKKTEDGRNKKEMNDKFRTQPLGNFEFLSQSATEMIDLPDINSIYKYICFHIQKNIPDSIVLIVSIDEKKWETRLIHVEGLEKNFLKKTLDITGFDPFQKKYKVLPLHKKLWKSGNIHEFKGGLADFASTEFPAKISIYFQKQLNIHKIYTIGINKGENLLSAVHIFTKNKADITDKNFLELFVKQAGIVIQKKLFEEKLQLQITVQDILYNIALTSLKDVTLEELLSVVQIELNRVMDATNFFVAIYQPGEDKLKRVIFKDEEDDYTVWKAQNSLSGQVVKLGKNILMDEDEISRFASSYSHKLLGAPAKCWLGVPIMIGRQAVGAMVVQSYKNKEAYDQGDVKLMKIITHELSLVIQKTKMIEELKAAKEKAEQSDRLKSAFLANMSHEIRTPMNGIIGFLNLLNKSDIEEKNRKKFLDIVNKSGERLLDTINDIIEISKIESGETELSVSVVNIKETLDYFYQFFKVQTDEKGLELKLSLKAVKKTTTVLTDKTKLESILTNLIKNAVKFTKHGSIEIGNYFDGEYMVFYVKDTGSGIPANRIDAIFHRFVQADLSISRGHEGSGLGLSIARAYAETLGGTLWVKSELGKGSTFFCSIPFKPADGAATYNKAQHTAPQNKPEKMTILVAEDDNPSFLYLEQLLHGKNIQLIQAVNGIETVKIARENPKISLILMDIQMPEMDGLEATRQIRKFNKTIPIIAETAFGFSDDREKVLAAGCNDYLVKPLKDEELVRMVKTYTGRSI